MRSLEAQPGKLGCLQVNFSIYKQNPEIDWSNIDLLCTCIENAVWRLAGLTLGSVCSL